MVSALAVGMIRPAVNLRWGQAAQRDGPSHNGGHEARVAASEQLALGVAGERLCNGRGEVFLNAC